MAIYRAQISFPVDTQFAVDALTITPHYFGTDAQALADRLKSNLSGFASIGGAKPFTIRIYDAQKAPPSYPLATAQQAGTPPASSVPRELALCLSYYSTFNRPRNRGRVYIPACFIAGAAASRPSGAQQAEALSWHEPLTNGLPPSTNMVVYSRMNDQSYGVDNFWVDDEWDIVRSRGRKPTQRITARFP